MAESDDFLNQPDLAGGIAWDDQMVKIVWPMLVSMLNKCDACYSNISEDDFVCIREQVAVAG